MRRWLFEFLLLDISLCFFILGKDFPPGSVVQRLRSGKAGYRDSGLNPDIEFAKFQSTGFGRERLADQDTHAVRNRHQAQNHSRYMGPSCPPFDTFRMFPGMVAVSLRAG